MPRQPPIEPLVINDVDRFSELVEARPALYMKNLKEYADINVKKKLWQEICVELFPNWGELSAENKIQYGQNIQQKWLNLRTCFSRELKAQKDVKSGQATPKRRRYVYFEKLLFLLPTMEQRTTEGNLQEETTAEPENPDLEEIVEANAPARPPTSTNRKRKVQHRDTMTIEEGIINALRQEPDEDTNFALSLVPQLRSLSEDDKFDAKIEILRVLQQIKRRRSLNFHPTLPPQQFTYRSAATVNTQPYPSTSHIHPHISSSAVQQYNQPQPQQSTYPITTSPSDTDETLISYVSQFTPGSSASEEILEL